MKEMLYEIELFVALHLWKVVGVIAALVLIVSYALA